MIKLILLALGFLWPYIVNIGLHLLAVVGVGFLTYGAVTTGFNTLVSRLETAISAVPAGILMIASNVGVGHVCGCLLAGMATRFAMAGIADAKKLIFRKST